MLVRTPAQNELDHPALCPIEAVISLLVGGPPTAAASRNGFARSVEHANFGAKPGHLGLF
eukprot:6898853-Karenia_brevis.AAC.1